MKTRKPWHDDDRFWNTFASKMFTQDRWTKSTEEIDQILCLLKPKPGARILDMCCGPGRHSLELARRGFEVTGVDRTTAYLREARQRARTERLNVQFRHGDMRTYSQSSRYDAAINMFTAFGYFEKASENRRVLRNLWRSLRKGGKLLIDLNGKEVLARKFQERFWYEQDGAIYLEQGKVLDNWNRVQSNWIMIKGTKRSEIQVKTRLFSADELIQLLRSCGFRKVNIFGSLEGIEYNQKAKRLVALATK